MTDWIELTSMGDNNLKQISATPVSTGGLWARHTFPGDFEGLFWMPGLGHDAPLYRDAARVADCKPPTAKPDGMLTTS
ncbi:hypothetical protein [Roseicyclus marinus]|uniref:hypothetical protein n=1 Tax=Roseicyclus marinus TaxID=2161673 RepID=UPI00240ECEAB|nr:hypothetical protein [Roseicyclus marinus]MDG3040421.1 hypothetical protein [Roseicyclus marinus]